MGWQEGGREKKSGGGGACASAQHIRTYREKPEGLAKVEG